MRHVAGPMICALLIGGCAAEEPPERLSQAPAVPQSSAVKNEGGKSEATTGAPAVRKIIFTTTLEVAVTRFDGVMDEIARVLKQFPGAYISDAESTGSQGIRRTGRWTLRVPQERQEEITAALRNLGEVKIERKQSDEVTEQYYDLSARIKNKKETEQRLLSIQAERTGSLEQILSVEREIARVREEIERLQGQFNRLDDLSKLATIQLVVTAIQSFHDNGRELTFGDRIGGAWNDSLGVMLRTGQRLAVFTVAVVPWLPFAVALAFVARVLWRISVRRKSQTAAA